MGHPPLRTLGIGDVRIRTYIESVVNGELEVTCLGERGNLKRPPVLIVYVATNKASLSEGFSPAAHKLVRLVQL